MSNSIRDIREQKQLSEGKVARAARLTYNVFVRVQAGSGRTTPEEVQHVLDVLEKMEPGTRKLAGRPFKDPEVRAQVEAARRTGGSVAAIIAKAPAVTEPTASDEPSLDDLLDEAENDGEIEEETPNQRKARQARERRAAKKAASE